MLVAFQHDCKACALSYSWGVVANARNIAGKAGKAGKALSESGGPRRMGMQDIFHGGLGPCLPLFDLGCSQHMGADTGRTRLCSPVCRYSNSSPAVSTQIPQGWWGTLTACAGAHPPTAAADSAPAPAAGTSPPPAVGREGAGTFDTGQQKQPQGQPAAHERGGFCQLAGGRSK